MPEEGRGGAGSVCSVPEERRGNAGPVCFVPEEGRGGSWPGLLRAERGEEGKLAWTASCRKRGGGEASLDCFVPEDHKRAVGNYNRRQMRQEPNVILKDWFSSPFLQYVYGKVWKYWGCCNYNVFH